MDEYIKLFFEGEALQQMLACFCNAMSKRMSFMEHMHEHVNGSSSSSHCAGTASNKGSKVGSNQQMSLSHGTAAAAQNKNTICKVLCTMVKSPICLRLTPVGLSPMVSDISLVFPYTQMSKVQVDFLYDILHRATFNAAPNTADPIKAIGYGNEVVVVTTLNSQKIWNTVSFQNRPALVHTFAANAGITPTSTNKKKCMEDKGQHLQHLQHKQQYLSGLVATDSQHCKEIHQNQVMQEAAQLIQGNFNRFHLDEADVLKAFCACVFRSKTHKDNALREGICNVILQMVIGEVGTTRDILKDVSDFIQAAKTIS